MANSAELETNISDYQNQLELVSAALLNDEGNSEMKELESQLKTLIQLTKDSLLEIKKKELLADIDKLDGNNETNTSNESLGGSEDLQDSLAQDLEQLIGITVSAPVKNSTHKYWGNAVIVGVEDTDINGLEYNEIRVKVAFSHPTEQSLLPCKYYLEGKCDRDPCKWSHGELVKLGEVKGADEIDFTAIQEGSLVLVKGGSGVWERGRVEDVCMGEYLVRLDRASEAPVSKSLEELFPLSNSTGNDNENISNSSFNDSLNETSDQSEFVPTEICHSGIRFGEWESHTKGIGSNLMLKMGWVVGQGLGKAGEGKVEPVSARVYPLGKSLDWCMEKREELGGGSILDVENILKKEAKEAERKSKLRTDAMRRRDNSAKSLFDFINIKLGSNITATLPENEGYSTNDKSKNRYSNHKNKLELDSKDDRDQNLKIKQFKTSEQIIKAEKDLNRLKESYNRHKDKDPKTCAGIKVKMDEKVEEIAILKSRINSLKGQVSDIKSKTKLTIF